MNARKTIDSGRSAPVVDFAAGSTGAHLEFKANAWASGAPAHRRLRLRVPRAERLLRLRDTGPISGNALLEFALGDHDSRN